MNLKTGLKPGFLRNAHVNYVKRPYKVLGIFRFYIKIYDDEYEFIKITNNR